MTTLDRRAFLVRVVIVAPSARLSAIAQQTRASVLAAPISRDGFLRLSQRLVGRTRLDPEVGATYLNALLAVPGNVPLLSGLVRNTGSVLTPAHVALERTIIEWWYTGTYTLGGERRIATHTGALMWAALGMPAPGNCAGAFGAWSRPPRAIA